ncbi:transcription factor IIA [Aphelenchoides avenae]|nr:transcription factor IIA [Aphelenchus avenae]
MAQPTAGHAVEDIYRGVIQDVISQVKEAFYDDNVDIEILQQLKKAWEAKVNASGSVDLDGTTAKALPPPAIRPQRQTVRAPPTQVAQMSQGSSGGMPGPSQQSQPAQQTVGMQQRQPTGGHPQSHQVVHHQPLPQLVQHHVQSQQPQQSQSMPSQLQQISAQGGQNVRFVQVPASMMQARSVDGVHGSQSAYQLIQPSSGQQSYIVQGQIGPNGQIVLLPGGQQFNIAGAQPIALGGLPMQATQLRQEAPQLHAPQPQKWIPSKSEPGVHQLDGASGVLLSDDDEAGIAIAKESKNKGVGKTAPAQKKSGKKVAKIAQLDGGPGMDDESSSEEGDEDPLQRLADLDDDNADDDDVVEEEPLNTDDDQSDDEDVDTLFDADNVVVCQFEKVHRARSKWKFTLKDGIMHVNGKDYCFQRCVGEAEW